jgi:hypothetical protein
MREEIVDSTRHSPAGETPELALGSHIYKWQPRHSSRPIHQRTPAFFLCRLLGKVWERTQSLKTPTKSHRSSACPLPGSFHVATGNGARMVNPNSLRAAVAEEARRGYGQLDSQAEPRKELDCQREKWPMYSPWARMRPCMARSTSFFAAPAFGATGRGNWRSRDSRSAMSSQLPSVQSFARNFAIWTNEKPVAELKGILLGRLLRPSGELTVCVAKPPLARLKFRPWLP